MKQVYSFLFSMLSLATFGQNPMLIKTVGGTSTEPGNNIIQKIKTPWNGKIFYESRSNQSLVVTDGTNGGTQVIKTFDAGFAAEAIYPAKDFVYVAVLKTDAVFVPPTSFNITYTRQLWRSDGTAAGTTLLKTFDPTPSAANTGVFSSNPQLNANFSISENTMYFNGFDATNGNELWVSDGTPGGTRMVKNIRPGNTGSTARAFCKTANGVLFSANDGTGSHLWKTDGTEAGTTILTTINAAGGVGFDCGRYKNKMYFWGNDGVNGTELWSSDGTAAGTSMVKDITPGNTSPGGAARIDMMFLTDDNYLYFVANNNGPVWRTDGTEAGTIQLHPTAAGGSTAGGAFAKGNAMYWIINTDTLFKTNGTPESTVRVRNDLNVGVGMFVYKNAGWFNARFGITDVEPWRTDGVLANKALDVYPGSGSSDPFGYFELNNYMYFFANNASGRHLFRYNGDMTFNPTVAGNNWKDSANWNSLMPPGITDTAYINVGAIPNINGVKAYAGTLIMQPGSSLNFANATDTLFINRNLNGTSATGNGTVVLRNAGVDTVKVNAAFTASNINAQGFVSLNNNLTVNNNVNLTNNARLLLNNSNMLLTGTASSINGNAVNYVVTNGIGKLSIENIGIGGRTSGVVFPIGSATNYNPVTILNAGASDAFSARTQPGLNANYSGEMPAGNAYSTGAVNNTWFINEASAGGSNATITLQWNASQELPGFDRTQSSFSHYMGGSWLMNTPQPALGTNPYTVTGVGVTSFSPFSVMNSSATLPIFKVELRVKKTSVGNQLSWSIIAENVEAVTVERSVDARQFSSISTTSFSTTGAYSDNSPSPKTYYRIKVIDKNGGVKYSNVVVINAGKSASLVTVFPTLVSKSFTVQNNYKAGVFNLYDANGKRVMQKYIAEGTNQIDANSLVNGIYSFVILRQNSIITSGKLSKL